MIHSSLNNEDRVVLQDNELSENEQPQGSTETEARTSSEAPAANTVKPAPAFEPPASSGVASAPAVANTTSVNAITPRPAVRPTPTPRVANETQRRPNQGTLVFVIDDAGNNLRELEPFLRIQGPLTIAVLPGLPYSAEAARRIRAAGKEVILHQPMEAIGGQNPGPGAIYSGMSEAEIRAVLARNIAEIGPVAGMNNHQGSRITMDRDAMRVILAFCKEHNLYFLDSRTIADSVVPAVAREVGTRIVQRNVFIDNEQSREAMLRYIAGGLSRAQRDGSVIMIGHTWSPALAPLLAEQFPLLMEQGYTIKTALDIVGN
jgi:hypothetical protein